MTRAIQLGILGVAAGMLFAIAAPPAAAGTPQPDGEVKQKNESYIGHGVINENGDNQTASAIRDQGKTAIFKFRYENVGSATDDFVIEACDPSPLVRARFFRGTKNVTEKALTGILTIRDVAPGERTPVIRAEVKVRSVAPDGVEVHACVSATGSNPLDSDRPAWQVVVPA